MTINGRSPEEVHAWLRRALSGLEAVPRLTPDESLYLGIVRFEKTLNSTTREDLRGGTLQLVRSFCQDGSGEPDYLEQLIALAAAFRDPESVYSLANLARKFPKMKQIPIEIRLATFAALVDTPPPQSPGFWNDILKQDPEKYAGLALSGVLTTIPTQAVSMLPSMPNTKRAGQAAALKLDLAWDYLPPGQRSHFVRDVKSILRRCGQHFAPPVAEWTDSKQHSIKGNSYPGLKAALSKTLGRDFPPRVLASKLYACLTD